MPYITQEDRNYIDQQIISMYDGTVNLTATILKNAPSGKVKGAFNYFVMRLFCHTFDVGNAGYTDLSDSIAVMGDMEHELRRRLLDPYEDKVMKLNGDLPELEIL